jgi:hypothetical protein
MYNITELIERAFTNWKIFNFGQTSYLNFRQQMCNGLFQAYLQFETIMMDR